MKVGPKASSLGVFFYAILRPQAGITRGRDSQKETTAPSHFGARMASYPPSLAWQKCRRLGRERSCLRVRISPTMQREQYIRPCDVCPMGTQRAYALAMHHRKQNALAVA